MSPAKPLLLSAAFFLSACISLPEVEGPEDPPDDVPDSGIPLSLTVTLAAPSGMTYTNSTVSVQLQLQGDTPESVELLVDDQPLTTLQAPYAFTWDTASVTEGLHQLSARARIADKTFSSEAREVLVDRTSPQVMSRTPSPGAQDVWVRQPIQATFSEPLKASTLTSVRLTVGGIEVVASSSLSTDGKTLTVTPSSRPRVPNSLELTLPSAATDLAGNTLSLPTAAWTWSLPVSFSMGGLNAVPGNTSVEAPSLELDSQGRPFVAWREHLSGTTANIYVSYWTGTDWEAIGSPVNSAPTTTNHSPDTILNQMIRVDSSNSPVVAWAQADSSAPGIHVKRWSNNSWASVGNHLNAFPQSNQFPGSLTLQLDTNDRPIVAWEQTNNLSGKHTLNVWKWTGQDWIGLGGPLIVSQIAGQAFPSLILDRSDNPIIAWASADSIPEIAGIVVRRWTGSEWEQLGLALDAVAQDSTLPTTPSLILDSTGAPVVAWSELNGTHLNIYTYRWTDTAWQPLGDALNTDPGNAHASGPVLAKDSLGNLFIMWCEGAREQISRWNGLAWESLGGFAGPSYCPSAFTVDSSGTPFVAQIKDADPPDSFRLVNTYRYNY